MSLRRACRVLGLSLSTAFYRPRGRPADQPVIERMLELAEKHPRCGQVQIHRMLKREKLVVNKKRTARLYSKLGLRIDKRGRRQRKYRPCVRRRRPAASRPHQIWAIDFMFDTLINGRQLKILTAIDEYTRLAVCIGIDYRIDAIKAVQMLAASARDYGCHPEMIRSDNGREFTGHDFGQWAAENEIQLARIQPGKPVQNAYVESFNGRLRDECLSIHVFATVAAAREIVGDWKHFYNHQRPHSGLDGHSPAQFAQECHKQIVSKKRKRA